MSMSVDYESILMQAGSHVDNSYTEDSIICGRRQEEELSFQRMLASSVASGIGQVSPAQQSNNSNSASVTSLTSAGEKKPTASLAKYLARSNHEKQKRANSTQDEEFSGMAERTPMIVTPSSDPTLLSDPIIAAAAYLKHQHPADFLTRPETKNFIPGDARVLVLYASGAVGLKKDGQGYYVPAKSSLRSALKTLPMLHDPDAPQSNAELITPASYYGKRVKYDVREYDPLMDSSSMDMHDWIKLAQDIVDNYEHYDGFVIVHGIDTMTYSASALSFLLEHIGKTVIFTGGLIPLCEPRSDAVLNLVDAITLAGHFVIPEICIYCCGKLMRGSRCVRRATTDFNVFSTPNAPLLGRVGVSIEMEWRNVRQPTSVAPLTLHEGMCSDVAVLHLFPGITIAAVKALLQPPIKGIVLRSFGAGTAPSVRHDVLHAIKAATASGIVIVNTTQSCEGSVDSSEAARLLARVGVVSGGDMTLEGALTKLAFLLAQHKDDPNKVRKRMTQDIHGEISVSVANKFSAESDELLLKLSQLMDVSSEGEGEELRDYLNSMVMCNAAQNGDLASMKMLVESGAGWQVDVQDYDSRTPLHIAAVNGHSEVAEYLITKGARVHHKDRHGYTPLIQAIISDNPETAAVVAKAGGSLGLPPGKIAELMNQAVLAKNTAQVQLFIKHGADPQATDYSKTRPLVLAVQEGAVEIVKLLLASGDCDLNARDWWGYTPLEVAREAQSRSAEPACYVFAAIADLLSQQAAVVNEAHSLGDHDGVVEHTGDTIDT
ncbi:L-asparaginase [Diplonema papillatum]|nr:L-asparaginase [Diplonema papillatum]